MTAWAHGYVHGIRQLNMAQLHTTDSCWQQDSLALPVRFVALVKQDDDLSNTECTCKHERKKA